MSNAVAAVIALESNEIGDTVLDTYLPSTNWGHAS